MTVHKLDVCLWGEPDYWRMFDWSECGPDFFAVLQAVCGRVEGRPHATAIHVSATPRLATYYALPVRVWYRPLVLAGVPYVLKTTRTSPFRPTAWNGRRWSLK